MAIQRSKLAGWGIGDKLTSGELNALDINGTYALDKRAGETDTLESVVTCAGAGRLIASTVVGADADTTYAVAAGIGLIRVTSSLTGDREYTLDTTGAETGDVITVVYESGSHSVTIVDSVTSAVLAIVGPDNGLSDGESASFYFRSQWRPLRTRRGKQYSELFTSDGEWTCPSGVDEVTLYAVGGGGGGGGGARQSAGDSIGGGGGGAGAALGVMRVPVTPGTTYTITVGAGGPGGAGATVDGSGLAGQDGGDTSFSDGMTTTYAFRGAGGGSGGVYKGSGTYYAPGGRAQKFGTASTAQSALSLADLPRHHDGGWGSSHGGSGSVASAAYRTGGSSAVAAGAVHGANNIATGSAASLGGGGGGASGFEGSVAGAGGAGNGNAAGSAGAAGTLGAGGGGGAYSGASFNGGDGGAGGDGALRLVYVK